MAEAVGSAQQGGIPAAPFVANVDDFVSDLADVDRVLQQFQEAIAKYKFMQDSLQKTSTNLDDKIPEIKKTLDVVDYLIEARKDDEENIMTTKFELNDTLFAEALVPKTDIVYIWLGVCCWLD